MKVEYVKLNLANDKGHFLKHDLSAMTSVRADAWWGIEGAVKALVKEFPKFATLKPVLLSEPVETTAKRGKTLKQEFEPYNPVTSRKRKPANGQ